MRITPAPRGTIHLREYIAYVGLRGWRNRLFTPSAVPQRGSDPGVYHNELRDVKHPTAKCRPAVHPKRGGNSSGGGAVKPNLAVERPPARPKKPPARPKMDPPHGPEPTLVRSCRHKSFRAASFSAKLQMPLTPATGIGIVKLDLVLNRATQNRTRPWPGRQECSITPARQSPESERTARCSRIPRPPCRPPTYCHPHCNSVRASA